MKGEELESLFKKDFATRPGPFSIRIQVGEQWRQFSYQGEVYQRMSPDDREKYILAELNKHLGKEDAAQWLQPVKVLMIQAMQASNLGVVINATQQEPLNQGELGSIRLRSDFSPPVLTIHKASDAEGTSRVTSIDYSNKWAGIPEFIPPGEEIQIVNLREKVLEGELFFNLTMPKEGATISKLHNQLSSAK